MSAVSDAPRDPGAPADSRAAVPGAASAFHFTSTDAMLLLMATIWGVNFSVMKFGAAAFNPVAFNALRVVLAALALAAIAFAPKARRPSAADAKRLMLLGLLGHALYQFLFLNGLHRARAGTAALVIAGTPALIAILLQVTGHERITRRAAVGIALSLTGIGLVVSAAAAPGAPDDSPLGLLMVLGASLCWAFYTLGLRPLTHRVDGVQIAAWTVFGAVIPMVLMGLPSLLDTDFRAVPPAAWGAVLYSAFLAFVVAYLFWYRGVRILGPVRTAMYANLQPIIALGVAWLVLHERPTSIQFIGAACVVGGVYLSRR
jgi:drug/metabolite transporter (DMT)-like permease